MKFWQDRLPLALLARSLLPHAPPISFAHHSAAARLQGCLFPTVGSGRGDSGTDRDAPIRVARNGSPYLDRRC